MSRYSRVVRRMWTDEKFRKLSAPKPNARDLWIHLLTGEHCTSLPGLFVMGIATMAEAMEWPLGATKKCLDEILAQDMARFDPVTRVVWLPRAIRHNAPENFNVIVGWKTPLESIPECQLRTDAIESLRKSLEGLDAARDPAPADSLFAHAFAIALGHAPSKRSANPSGKGRPNPSVSPSPNPSPNGPPKGRPTPDPDPDPEPEQKTEDVVPKLQRDPARERARHNAAIDDWDARNALTAGGIRMGMGGTDEREWIALLGSLPAQGFTIADFVALGECVKAGAATWWTGEWNVRTLLGKHASDGGVAGRGLIRSLEEARAWKASTTQSPRPAPKAPAGPRMATADALAALRGFKPTPRPGAP